MSADYSYGVVPTERISLIVVSVSINGRYGRVVIGDRQFFGGNNTNNE